MRTVNGVMLESFVDAPRALGLFKNELIAKDAINEACADESASAANRRFMLTIMAFYGCFSNNSEVFDSTYISWELC